MPRIVCNVPRMYLMFFDNHIDLIPIALKYFLPTTVGSNSLNLLTLADNSSNPRSSSPRIPSSVLTDGSLNLKSTP